MRSVTSTSEWQLLCGHGEDDACLCALAPSGRTTAQSLQEMEFTRSACAAAQQGNVERLRKLLQANPAAVHSDGTSSGVNPTGYTPLHYAARAGHLAAVQLLLSMGAVVDATTREGQSTPLHRAAAQGHVAVAQALLAAGADPLKQDADGETPLHKAAAEGHAAVCTLLLAVGAGAASCADKRGRLPAERARGAQLRQAIADAAGAGAAAPPE